MLPLFDRKFTKARNAKWIDPHANKNVNMIRDIKYKFLLMTYILQTLLLNSSLFANKLLPFNIYSFHDRFHVIR